MTIRTLCLTPLLALLLAGAARAQNDAQALYNGLPTLLQVVGMKSQMNEQAYAWAQQMGDGQEMQRCQAEAQMHQQMYNGVTQLMQNPQQLNDPRVQQQLLSAVNEYNYRTDCRDMRPFEQIQGALAQYIAQAQWKAGTPEGQAYHQANINGINANTAQMTANHNQRMADLNAQADARNAAWSQQQAMQDGSHQRFVHGIYNEYQYVNPNTNQGYWVPLEMQNPAVVNPNGSYTQLVPYQSY